MGQSSNALYNKKYHFVVVVRDVEQIVDIIKKVHLFAEGSFLD